MSGYLLDTNVISELRKRERASPRVRAWLATVDDADLFLSVLVIGELRKGVELVARRDPSAAASLETWLRGVLRDFDERILPVSSAVALAWGRLDALGPVGAIDGLLAATALVHGLTLVTRNVRDVRRTGPRVLDPFAAR